MGTHAVNAWLEEAVEKVLVENWCIREFEDVG